jgi:hypothetical protein
MVISENYYDIIMSWGQEENGRIDVKNNPKCPGRAPEEGKPIEQKEDFVQLRGRENWGGEVILTK